MIYIGLGANLPSVVYGEARHTLAAAVARLRRDGIEILGQSPWYRTAPVPASDQPWFVNGVIAVATALTPAALLALLQQVEADFGRRREETWGARVIDLDLLAYHDLIVDPGDDPAGLCLPHPRLHQRAFVLRPLLDLAPGWHHPVSGRSAAELLAAIGPEQATEPLPAA
ncbi:MAG TPA: 2-amino-4-hydroxy-6-hydroxymethyldihydropteridine diphosphokinase [Candidatus Sulfotelmatobacter sp.]|nr:2-amino-4-hydroxy-6-hydroxymethyldihydropteridine diphosphokinase [Candidatus Sulfotelmatobacter sp.]